MRFNARWCVLMQNDIVQKTFQVNHIIQEDNDIPTRTTTTTTTAKSFLWPPRTSRSKIRCWCKIFQFNQLLINSILCNKNSCNIEEVKNMYWKLFKNRLLKKYFHYSNNFLINLRIVHEHPKEANFSFAYSEKQIYKTWYLEPNLFKDRGWSIKSVQCL